MHPAPIIIKKRVFVMGWLQINSSFRVEVSVVMTVLDRAMIISDTIGDTTFYVNCCVGTGARLSGAPQTISSEQENL